MTSVLWRGRAESVLLRSIVFVMVSVIFAITVISNPYARPEKQLQGWLWLIPILVLGGALVAAVMFTRLSVEVTDVEVRIVYGWGWPVQRILWDTVKSVQVINVRPVEWGGWGYRWVPWRRGSAAVMRAGSGFRFDFANGKVFVVTVDDADAGLEIIRGVLATK
jgi:hypothetical protein